MINKYIYLKMIINDNYDTKKRHEGDYNLYNSNVLIILLFK